MTDLKESVATSEMDDESDSCFSYKKSHSQMFHNKRFDKSSHESDNCDLNSSKSLLQVASITMPPIVKKTSSSLTIPNIVSIKATSNTLPNINTIADNLKNKLSPKQKEQPIPKVSLVNKVKLNIKSDSKSNKSILNDENLNKVYAHKLILYKLSQAEAENNDLFNNKRLDEDEINDDLTNLSWLTTFNLSNYINSSKFNLLSLSPPKSPSSSPSSPNSLSSLSQKSLNSTIRDYDDDEADSNALHRREIKISNQLLTNILHQNESQRPPYSFSCLIFLAIETSERKRLSVKEIYSWISQTFSYYHNVPSGSWKNSIRHNLSFNKCFSKVDKNLLAMRDFSGKGSLWCVDPKIRLFLVDLFQKCTISNNLEELAKNPNLKDINEMPLKPMRHNSGDTKKCNKIKMSPTLNQMHLKSAQPTIVNPKLVSRFASTVMPKITNVTANKSLLKSNSFNSANVPTTLNSPALEACSEMDAVKALLSMKSKASSMPTISTEEEKITMFNDDSTPKNRRKQLFKQPIKKCSKYEDDEDEDVDVEEDYFIDEEDEDEEFDESYSTQENDKSNICDPMTDDEEDDENGKLEIDEDFTDEQSKKKTSKDMDSNPLLELSRAAVLVEKDEPYKKKLKTETSANNILFRSTRSMSTISLPKNNLSKTMTRSKSKLNETK